MVSVNLCNVAFVNIKGARYCCIISWINKSEAINLLENTDLTKKSCYLVILILKKINFTTVNFLLNLDIEKVLVSNKISSDEKAISPLLVTCVMIKLRYRDIYHEFFEKLEKNLTNFQANKYYVNKKLQNIYTKKVNDIRIRRKCNWYQNGEISTKFTLNLSIMQPKAVFMQL